jgi:cold shock CspA family protein
MRTQGKITHWNEQKGYGFITPAAGAKQVFVHISALNNRRQPPKLKQLISFSLSTDKQGRPCAEKVIPAGEKQPGESKRTASILMILILIHSEIYLSHLIGIRFSIM